MGLPFRRIRSRAETAPQDHRRDPGAIPNPGGSRACERASAVVSQSRNLQPGMPDHGWPDRSLHRADTPSLSRRSSWRRAGQRGANVLPVREVLHVGPEPLGPAALAGLPAAGIQQACGPSEHRGMAALLMALAQERQWSCTENGSLHLERDEARLQVRRQVGLPKREPNGREAGRTAPWLDQTTEAAGAINRRRVLPAPKPTWGLARKWQWPLRAGWVRASAKHSD